MLERAIPEAPEERRYFHTYANSESIAAGATEAFVIGPFPDGSRVEECTLTCSVGTSTPGVTFLEFDTAPGLATTTGGVGEKCFPRDRTNVTLNYFTSSFHRVLRMEEVPRGKRYLRAVITNSSGGALTYIMLALVSSPASPLP